MIEDATLAVGAEHNGRRAGTFGRAGCYSFSPGKILGSYGDGGAITTDDPALAERLLVLRNYGHDPSMTDESGSTRFGGLWKIAAEGFNDRLDTLQAAILNAKLPSLDDRIAARRRIAQEYNDRLAGLALQTPPIDPTDPTQRHVFRAYTILVDNRDQVRAHLAPPASPASSTTPHPSTSNPPTPTSTSAPAPSQSPNPSPTACSASPFSRR